jgi:hypothetical protein
MAKILQLRAAGSFELRRNKVMKQEIVVQSSKWFRSVLLLVVIGGCFFLAAPCALAAADSRSCSTDSENRQLDFWVGDWTVTYPGMTGNAMSNVSLSLDKCLFTESWDGGKGHSGKNMFAYSADDKSWHGMFTDNQGRVHVFAGKVGPGAAEFTGPSRGPNGETVLNRIKVVRINTNKVEQSWEKSTDNGATWTKEFSGEYSRKNL